MTKKVAKKYFNSFSEGDLIDLGKLVKICEKKDKNPNILED